MKIINDTSHVHSLNLMMPNADIKIFQNYENQFYLPHSQKEQYLESLHLVCNRKAETFKFLSWNLVLLKKK